MKNKFCYPLLFLLFLVYVPAMSQANQEAARYLYEITAPFEQMKGETWQYLRAVTKGRSARKIENKRFNLIKEVVRVKTEIASKPSFGADDSLKFALIDYLNVTTIVLREDFKKILDMEDIAEQSYDLMEAYILAKERASLKLQEASDSTRKVYDSFAARHNIKFSDPERDKRDEKIERANKALSYYNDVYLVFFKSFKQEIYVMEAMSRNDVAAIDQNASTLSSFATEGLDELNSLGNFNNDGALRAAAQHCLKFYLNEANNNIPILVDFLIKKESLEKAKKIIESKNQRSLTQQEIDQYNKSIAEYNKAAQNANKIQNSSSTLRSKWLKTWEMEAEKFFNKHGN